MPASQLTPCELEVMDAVWSRGAVTVQDVVDAIDRNLAYTTVMTTLKILEEKGVVSRCGKLARAFIYEARVSRDEVQKAMAGQLSKSLFGGSLAKMVLSLIDPGSVSSEEVSELRSAIRRLEGQK
jgi:BlaI family penicillinase repressor